jgi:hypothetical protein
MTVITLATAAREMVINKVKNKKQVKHGKNVTT